MRKHGIKIKLPATSYEERCQQRERENATRKHIWGADGFCVYCHNVHRTDADARSTCSDGFRCLAADP